MNFLQKELNAEKEQIRRLKFDLSIFRMTRPVCFPAQKIKVTYMLFNTSKLHTGLFRVNAKKWMNVLKYKMG